MARTTRPHSTDYDYHVVTKTLKHELSHEEIDKAWKQFDSGSLSRNELSDLLAGNHSGWYGNVRTDTNQVLGICTEQYGRVQNADLIGTIEEACDNVNMRTMRRTFIAFAMVRVFMRVTISQTKLRQHKSATRLACVLPQTIRLTVAVAFLFLWD